MPPADLRPGASWNEYRQHVLRELARLDADQRALEGAMNAHQRAQEGAMNAQRLEVAKLKIQAAVLGAAAGAVLNLVPTLLALLRR